MPIESHLAAQRPLRVLVADDDPIQRDLIRSRLISLNGQSIEAEDGNAAWALLTAQSFDIAIVDLGMPGLDGLGLIQCMRSHPRTRHLPIIVVTSRDDKDSIAAAFAAGASSFLVKPIVWGTFEHHVGFLLRLAQAARDARTSGQKLTATDRAKEALLCTLSGEAIATTQAVLDQIRALKSPQLQSDRMPSIVERLNTIEADCAALLAQATRAAAAMQVFREQINVDDRGETLSDMVWHVIDELHPAALSAGVHMSVSLPQQDALVSCDAAAIELALLHLLQNAIAHSPSSTTTTLTAQFTADGMLAIEVLDEGQGMEPETIARHLSPHYTSAHRSAPAAQPGFGLLLAKGIVEAHNGTLELRSMPRQGTSALLCLPADRISRMVAAA